MKNLFLVLMITVMAPFAKASEMSIVHSAYVYKTISYYTGKTGTIHLDRLGCKGKGLFICSYEPSFETAGSFGWVTTTLALAVLLENYVVPQVENGVTSLQVYDLTCEPDRCTFNL